MDERSDLFSLACVLYESLCGGKPFVAASPADSLKRIEAGVETPSELLPDIPASAEHALLQALSPTPESRPVRADDFAEAFLSEMGNARQGKKSLARIIARMTSDEMDPVEPTQDDEPTVTDPAKGLLGTRYPQARLLLGVIASGLGVAWPSFAILHAMGLAQAPAALSAIVIGAAGGARASDWLGPACGRALHHDRQLDPPRPRTALPCAHRRIGNIVVARYGDAPRAMHQRHSVVTYALSASPSLPADACLVGACLAAYLTSPAEAGISVRARHDLREAVASRLHGRRSPWSRYAGPRTSRFVLYRPCPHLRCGGGGALSICLTAGGQITKNRALACSSCSPKPARSSSPSASSVLRTLWKLPACAPRTSQMHLEPESYPL